MIQFNVTQYQEVKNLRLYFNTLDYRTPHFHRDIEILWALEGGVEIQAGSALWVVHEGEMLILNSGQPHEIKAVGRSCTVLGMHISPDFVKEEVPMLEDTRFEKCFVNELPEDMYKSVEQMMLDVTWQYLTKPPYYELYIKSKIQMFIHMLLVNLPHQVLSGEQSLAREQQNARLQRLIRFVDQNYMYNICLSDFAQSEERSISYMSHFVQKMMGQSFREYVDLMRYNAACKMMGTGQYKMLDICIECGFSDYRYFSKAFIRRTGLTPEVYSRQLCERIRDETVSEHSIHSRERFYTPEQSVQLVEKFRTKYATALCIPLR